MGVARHLNIDVAEYDARIRTFIPGYEQMIDAVADCLHALPGPCERIVELGLGSGAVADRCLREMAEATLVGVELDADILQVATHRLQFAAGRIRFIHADFLDVDIPACDVLVASLALHHVAQRERKQQLYRTIRGAMRAGGLLLSADCYPALDARLASRQHEAWRAHLRRSYSEEDTSGYFASWSEEDTYVPLDDERGLLHEAGFSTEVAWRLGPMAVIAGRPV